MSCHAETSTVMGMGLFGSLRFTGAALAEAQSSVRTTPFVDVYAETMLTPRVAVSQLESGIGEFEDGMKGPNSKKD